VFTSILSSSVNCNAICATHCSLCVRIGTTYSCTRDALFSAAD
jgi:hypothetical protein